ncbi:Alpha-1,2-mannosidase [hydrothermal vent metagenome]|uniref:Alpha-1,2-mannosidase n=1 Tax=hydrothermal vent metagenome TaxID=652676 RepID=A0A3B1DHW5_9ZZZZ
MKNIFWIVLVIPSIFLSMIFGQSTNSENLVDYTKLVDPMIGTDWNGHTFPGVTLPNGMVQLSPDTKTSTWNNCSGYHYSDKSILGFSHTHYSGTGAGGGGDILFMPTVGEIKLKAGDEENTESGYRSKFSHENESASPGYYSVFLDDYNIQVALTATKRVGFHKYTFPKSDQANVILDLAHGLFDSPDSLFLQVNENEISGYRAASGGLDNSNTIYFAGKFSKPYASYGLAINDTIRKNISIAKGKNVKAYFRFNTKENESVLLKVAISTVSIDGARKNLEAEIPLWNFDNIRRSARETWNKELNKIQVEGGTKDQQKIFYTAMYHALIHPNIYMDVDKKYRGIDGEIYKAENFDNYTTFSLWDTFRALHPLMTIIDQEKTNQYIKTFIERYEHGLNMPIMEFSGNETYTMIGYHSVSVLADAYVKGIRDYDVKKAYKAMKQLADGERAGKDDYLRYGFVPDDFYIESVSRTLEYSYDDWCVTRLAKDFNKTDYNKFSQRGEFYKNVFSKEVGFMRPKDSNYKWVKNFDPMQVTKLHYTEANAYQYTPFVPQDIKGLIELFGGDEKFEKWLDNYFTTTADPSKITDADVTGLIGQYAHGNEPSHHVAYLYNYAGVPWKTQKMVREIFDTQYNATPKGISGNDDTGQMSAWYIFSAMGFYPVTPGLDYYVIGSPLFDKVTINLENGNKFEIISKNNNADSPYIQSVTLNGENYSRSYLNHSDIMNGSKMVITMGNHPNKNWGTAKKDRPYSPKYECASVPMVNSTGRKFLESSSVSLSCENDKATIRYTLDGSEPDKNSEKFTHQITIAKTSVLKAKCFVDGIHPSYTVAFVFEKLKLQPALNVSNLKQGLKYIYKEVGCAKTADLDKYPSDNSGIISTFNIDSIKDQRAFGYIYEGFIKAPVDGLYTFYLESNDGSVLFLDNKLIIDNDGDHMLQTLYAKVALKKGFHSMKLKYFQMGGGKKLLVRWEKPNSDIEEIPAEVLYH